MDCVSQVDEEKQRDCARRANFEERTEHETQQSERAAPPHWASDGVATLSGSRWGAPGLYRAVIRRHIGIFVHVVYKRVI